MLNREMLLRELEQMPEIMLAEVLDFILFLKTRSLEEKSAPALLTEKILAKDWLRPEEDEAWASL
jgi:hypothetical protein